LRHNSGGIFPVIIFGTAPQESGRDFEENSNLVGILSIFSPEPEDFPNEEMQLPYRKKKKRRRYGRQV
jgi:hypothetical protein